MIFNIGFDGTCVSNNFPEVGHDIGAQEVLKKLVKNGHQLILFTVRANNSEGNYLDDAVQWFKDNNIPLYGINKNPKQQTWSTSPKPFANYMIDDTALGCPLILDRTKSQVPFVNWKLIDKFLKSKGII